MRAEPKCRANQSERLYWEGQPIRAQTLCNTDTKTHTERLYYNINIICNNCPFYCSLSTFCKET